MRFLAAIALLAAPASLGATGAVGAVALDVNLSAMGGCQFITGTVQVESAPGTYPAVGMAVDSASLTEPGPNAFWIESDSGAVNCSASDHACPSLGGDLGAGVEGAAETWLTYNMNCPLPGALQSLDVCKPMKLFIEVSQYGGGEQGLQGCGFDAIVAIPFTYTGGGACPTATPTPTAPPPTQEPTPTDTATARPTPTAGGPTPSPTAHPTQQAQAGLDAASAVPNPNPRQVAFEVGQGVQDVTIQVFTAAYSLVDESIDQSPAPGWNRIGMPQGLAPGTYLVKVTATGAGMSPSSRSFAVTILQGNT
jgi:hypothetical protein